MAEKIITVKLQTLPAEEIQPMLQESREQGFTFLDRLVQEFEDGTNRFEKPGEVLFGVYSGQLLVAVGGLNQDPYLSKSDVGRVRHLYVMTAWRRQGVGRHLMRLIIEEARRSFSLITLRTFREPADRFYRAIGFHTEPKIAGASHHLVL